MKRWNLQPENEISRRGNSTQDVTQPDPFLTLKEIALELRCSKAHASKILAGKVPGVTALPSVRMGTRVVVRRSTFEKWKAENESVADRCYDQRARNSWDERMGDKKHA